SVGYADGLFRSASGTDLRSGADVSIGGQLCPVVGRISMDLLTVDVTGVDPRLTGRGALVNILDDHVGIDGLAVAANTISYEVLTSLGRRYRRVYTSREK
ncbi:MAG: alanine racemase, partial [Variibacter sp.]|nr:alanine racemase [Variibacter sp.]